MSSSVVAVARPRVLVSRCLDLDPCRYDGTVVEEPLIPALAREAELVPVCPEVAIGLGVPRDPIRVVHDREGARRLVQPSTGRELSHDLEAFRAQFLDQLGAVDGAILKSRSPSCGVGDVKVFASAEASAPVGVGSGFFGEAVLASLAPSATPVSDERLLADPDERELFLTRVFALARLRAARDARSMAALVRFHAQHKLLLLAHHEAALRVLGPLVANPEGCDLDALWLRYQPAFRAALAERPSRGSRVNALDHSLGYFRDTVGPEVRHRLHATVERYQSGTAPLAEPLAAIRECILATGESYLAGQAFLWPYPDALRPRA